MSTAAVYIRTSSDGQLDGHGPEIQEQVCRAYSAHAGLTVTQVVVEAITGTTANRPVFLDAISDADAVIVADTSRLARDLVVQEVLLAEAWAIGTEVHAADSGLIHADDPDNPTRTLLRQVLGALSQWQKAELVSRLRRARRAAAPPGRRENCGQKPFGKDDREQTMLRYMLGRHWAGDSHAEIARGLNNRPGWHTRTGVDWTPRNVARVVSRATEAAA